MANNSTSMLKSLVVTSRLVASAFGVDDRENGGHVHCIPVIWDQQKEVEAYLPWFGLSQ